MRVSTQGLLPILEDFHRAFSPGLTDLPWVPEDGSESNLVAVIFNNMYIKIRKSLEISIKFNTETLCTFFFCLKDP